MRDTAPPSRPPAGRTSRRDTAHTGGPTRTASTTGTRRNTLVALTAAVAAVVLLVVPCGGTDGGDASRPRKASPVARPSPSPSPTSRWDTAPGSLAALGDSITRAYDACSLPADCPEASWATGTSPEVPSLARRLAIPAAARWNHAHAGALMADLPAQAAKAAAHRPELVTVLVGANDACRPSVARMTPVADFRADFTEALRILRRKSPETQVYVASVPDLERLWSLGREHPLAQRVWQLGICPSMLRDADAVDVASVERRTQVSARVRAYNTVLAEVCARDERCRHDGGAVHDHRFTARELSVWDWFHPGQEGQRRLAEIAHRGITAEHPPA